MMGKSYYMCMSVRGGIRHLQGLRKNQKTYMTDDQSRAAQPADVGVGELPKPEVKIERGRVWIVKGNQSFMLAYEPDADDPEMAEWYAKQLRCVLSGFTPCVNSTAQGEQPQQAAQGVKTRQERCDWMSDEPATKLMVEAMKSEIADLRAQLAAATENLQTAVQQAWIANAELSKLRAQIARQSQGEPAAWMVNFKRAPNAAPDRAFYWKYHPLVAGHVAAGDKVTPLYAAPPLSSEPQGDA